MSEVDVQKLEQKISEHEERLTELEKAFDGQDGPEGQQKQISLAELVQDVGPSTHQEKALAIGYHLECINGSENFTAEHVEDGYRRCKLKPPANIYDILANLASKGLIMEDGEAEDNKTLWVLTRSGESEIEEVLNHE